MIELLALIGFFAILFWLSKKLTKLGQFCEDLSVKMSEKPKAIDIKKYNRKAQATPPVDTYTQSVRKEIEELTGE